MAAQRKWRIMIVDDNVELLTSLFDALQKEFETIGAVNGLDALEKIDRYEPDVILLDVVMVGIDGIDTARAIRRNVRFQNTPIVLLSGREESEYRPRMRGLDIAQYLRKPVPPSVILEMCRKQIRKFNRRTPPEKRFDISELNTPLPGSERPPSAVAVPARKATPPSPPPSPVEKAGVSTPGEEAAATGLGAFADPCPPRVMIIDDEKEVVDDVIATLGDQLEVLGTTDPVSAIYSIIRYQPDLLLVDVHMPRLSGYQLSQLLRLNRNLKGTHVVFLSVRNSDQERDYARKLGACGYLAKPFRPDDLCRQLRVVFDLPDFHIREKAMSFETIRRSEQADPSPSLIL